MKREENKNKVIVFQGKNGGIELRSDQNNNTIWATQAEMAAIFDVGTQAITKHIKNIYTDKELIKSSTCSKMEQVGIEGGREVKRNLDIYNLEVVIAVGYRVNSVKGTKFRQWANKILKSYIVDGFAIQKKVIKNNLDLFLKDIKSLLPAGSILTTEQVLEISSVFANTWLSLDEYDRGILENKKPTKKSVKITAEQIQKALQDLKEDLMRKGEASDLFGADRNKNSLSGIVGNVMQAFGGRDLYESIEEKAAHLLYFVVKDHPFVDGNKRSGAFCFVWFLQKCKMLDINKINPTALTLLTLLVAESKPQDKNRIIKLIMKMIER